MLRGMSTTWREMAREILASKDPKDLDLFAELVNLSQQPRPRVVGTVFCRLCNARQKVVYPDSGAADFTCEMCGSPDIDMSSMAAIS